jgi:CBS domain containing-hemolysin-like protein
MQPPFFLADNVRADDVLPLLRRNRQHLALIRDAGGKVLGIVTVENILKILVGNLPASASGDRKTDPAPAILSTTPP